MRHPTGSAIANCPYTLPGLLGVGVGVELGVELTAGPDPTAIILLAGDVVCCIDAVLVAADVGDK